jgi:MFS family permease
VIVIALATIAISSTLTTQIDAPWQLDLLWGVANGLATGAIGVTLAAVIASRWFVERRGFVTGMLTASNATGQLVFLPLLGWIVTAQGWRSAALTVSIVALAFTPRWWRSSCRQPGRGRAARLRRGRGRPGDRAPEPVPGPSGSYGVPNIDVLPHRELLICGATTNGLIGTHLIPAAMDRHVRWPLRACSP